ncbi:hypothetical protein RJ639_042920 [Escallonia herrerae]|uniref:AT-hook motif nuclear-localized protein n=1 Tax=Escallonia herrerae TaxID=1293975 RepID=A0AA88WFW2_9ASTE|nr:hypothetical protein RJ639_042920 [Escallonia herrerae]
MMMSPPPQPNPSYATTYPNHQHHHHPNSSAVITPGSAPVMQQNPIRVPFDSVNPQPYGGDGEFGGTQKKKRGRPRKYPLEGNNTDLGLSTAPPLASAPAAAAHGDSGGVGTETSAKRSRGRPPGSGKKQLDALGVPGVGFTPHVIEVTAGEDIASKIMAFSQQGPRTVCILSANGAVSNVTLRQPATSGGTVTYEVCMNLLAKLLALLVVDLLPDVSSKESTTRTTVVNFDIAVKLQSLSKLTRLVAFDLQGRFEIISLSGSFLLSESNGNRSRTGGLSVSLAGSDGRVLGGGVAGMLLAATPVQVIVGSFVADGKKTKTVPSSAAPPNMVSPPSDGSGSSGGSADESGSSLREPVTYSNASESMPNMQPYQNIEWPQLNMH